MSEKRSDLVGQAMVLGLDMSGSKEQLAKRIERHLAGVAQRAAAVKDESIRVTSWHGKPNYHCTECGFASLKKRRTVIHIAEIHRR